VTISSEKQRSGFELEVARKSYIQNTLEISIIICYYNITKGTTDRRLVQYNMIKKVTIPFADGGYFLTSYNSTIFPESIFLYLLSQVTKIT